MSNLGKVPCVLCTLLMLTSCQSLWSAGNAVFNNLTRSQNASSQGTQPPAVVLSSLAYFVSPSGSDSNDGLTVAKPFQTLQKAADVATAGYTVYAMSGVYQNADYNSSSPSQNALSISTSGTSTAPITFTNYPGQSPKIQFNGYNGIALFPPASYIILSGFEVEGDEQDVTETYAQTASPTDFKVSANGISVQGNGSGGANEIVHHVTIEKMNVHDCPLDGIGTGGADYVTIQDNVVYRNAYWSPWAGSGISLAAAYDLDSNTTSYKNIIQRNISYGNFEYIPNFMAGNVVTDGNGIIIDSNNHQGTSDAPYQGKTLVTNNIVYNNGGTGIHSFQSANIDMVNNTAYSNNLSSVASGQIVAEYSSNVNIINNIMVEPSGKPVNTAMSDTAVSYDYNIYFGGTGAQVMGEHDVVADPQFTNPANADFFLGPNSPALSSGTSYLAPATDFLGNPRPSGSIARGAYQSSSQ